MYVINQMFKVVQKKRRVKFLIQFQTQGIRITQARQAHKRAFIRPRHKHQSPTNLNSFLSRFKSFYICTSAFSEYGHGFSHYNSKIPRFHLKARPCIG